MIRNNADPSRSDWQTPEWVLNLAREVIGGPIGLDPATTPENPTKAVTFYTKADNGLHMPWSADSIWLNPPWSRKEDVDARRWLIRAQQARQSARPRPDPFHMFVLTACGLNTNWFHDYLSDAERYWFPRGRIRFESPDLFTVDGSPKFDSMVTYYGDWPNVFDRVFGRSGKVMW